MPGASEPDHEFVSAVLHLLLPPDELVLTVAEHDERQGPTGGLEGLRRAVGVAALVDDRRDLRQRRQHGSDRFLRGRLVPVAVDLASDLEIGMLGKLRLDALRDVVVDARAGEAVDIQQIAAVRQALRDLPHFLGAVGAGEVDRDLGGARLGDEAVEGDHHDARVASLLDRAIDGARRRCVDHDGVIALEDQVLDLGRLGGCFLVGRRKGVGRGDRAVLDRLAADLGPTLQHCLAPRIAGVVVGERDLLFCRVGECGRRNRDREHRYDEAPAVQVFLPGQFPTFSRSGPADRMSVRHALDARA